MVGRLKHATEPGPEQAARQLRDTAGRGRVPGSAFTSYRGDDLVNAYVAWVNEIERILRHYFADPDLDKLHTARYWQICQIGAAFPRLGKTVEAEGSWQAERLDAIARDLDDTRTRLTGHPAAAIAVLDTNVFLHCHPLDQIDDWSFASDLPVRLVIPLRVIEELDDKKLDRNGNKADRARGRVRWLRDRLVPTNGQATQIRPGVSIEALVPPGRRELQPHADTEILESCELLETFTQKRVTIVTADLGMQLRGVVYQGISNGFKVVQVPDKYRLNLPSSTDEGVKSVAAANPSS